jgi:DNA-binding transcriptional MerR regulator
MTELCAPVGEALACSSVSPTTLLAPKTVAERLGLTTSRVIQLDREGALRAMRDSAGRRLYDEATVSAFIIARSRCRSTDRQVSGAAAQVASVVV